MVMMNLLLLTILHFRLNVWLQQIQLRTFDQTSSWLVKLPWLWSQSVLNRLYANWRHACEPPLTPIGVSIAILALWHRLHSKEQEAIALSSCLWLLGGLPCTPVAWGHGWPNLPYHSLLIMFLWRSTIMVIDPGTRVVRFLPQGRSYSCR